MISSPRLAIILALLTGVPGAARAEVALIGDTSRPTDSTFRLGDPIKLTFTASGLAAGQADHVTLVIRDEHDAVVERTALPITADADGHAAAALDLRGDRLGFYRVYGSLDSGAALAPRFTRPAGFLTYAVVADPAQRKDYGQAGSLFGLQGAFGPQSVAALPRLGARWVLEGRSWYWNEPKHAGEFHANAAAAKPNVFEQSLGASWNVYRVFCTEGVPVWAGKPETRAPGSRNAELTPEGETAYAAYCREAARDIVARYPSEPQHYYQPLWEPVTPWGYKGTDAGLVRISAIAYQAIHEIDPKAVVLGPCGSSIDTPQIQWTERLLRAGIGKAIDAVSTHPYVPHPAEAHGYIANLRAYIAATERAIGRKIPLFGTEQGISTGENVAEEIGQAQGLVRDNLITLGEGFACNFAFYFSDYHMGKEKGYGLYYNLDANKNWGSDLVSPKPVVPAYSAMTLLIDGHKSNGPLDGMAGNSVGYVFERDGDVIAAVWDSQRTDAPLDLPVGDAPVEVFDWMGRKLDGEVSNGVAHLKLGPEPVYVRGLPADLYGTANERRVSVQTPAIDVLAGDTAVVNGRVRLGKGERAADFSLGLDTAGIVKDAVAASISASGDFRVPVAVPASAVPGTYATKLVLLRNAKVVGLSGVALAVKPIIDLSQIAAAFDQGRAGVSVRIANKSRKRTTAHLKLSLDDTAASPTLTDVALEPGGTATQFLPVSPLNPVPTKRYRAALEASAAGFAPTNATAPVDFLAASRLNAAPTTDGDLADWAAIAPARLQGRENIVRSPVYYTGDLAAAFRFGWDDRALYFACEVESSTHTQPYHGADIWRGDCIQMGINLTPSGAATKTGNMLADQGSLAYTELSLALTSDGPTAVRSITFDPARLPTGAIAATDLPLAITRRGGKTIYEAALPWSQLGVSSTPPPSGSLGIAATVNKIYAPTQSDPCALGLFDGIASSKDPDRFGTLLLTR